MLILVIEEACHTFSEMIFKVPDFVSFERLYIDSDSVFSLNDSRLIDPPEDLIFLKRHWAWPVLLIRLWVKQVLLILGLKDLLLWQSDRLCSDISLTAWAVYQIIRWFIVGHISIDLVKIYVEQQLKSFERVIHAFLVILCRYLHMAHPAHIGNACVKLSVRNRFS